MGVLVELQRKNAPNVYLWQGKATLALHLQGGKHREQNNESHWYHCLNFGDCGRTQLAVDWHFFFQLCQLGDFWHGLVGKPVVHFGGYCRTVHDCLACFQQGLFDRLLRQKQRPILGLAKTLTFVERWQRQFLC